MTYFGLIKLLLYRSLPFTAAVHKLQKIHVSTHIQLHISQYNGEALSSAQLCFYKYLERERAA